MNAYGRIVALGVLTMSLVSCGGGGGGNNTASSPPPATTLSGTTAVALPTSSLATNQLAVVVEQEPGLSGTYATVNLPYVSVTICASATNCTTVNHVVVDTGSYGLRILQSALPAGFPLTPETVNTNNVAECVSFLDGFMWGSVVTATVQLNGETASSLPVQIVGDTAVPGISGSSIPSTCTGTGAGSPDESNLAGIGGNGILGVGLFTSDNQQYYTCTNNGSCTPYTLPPNQQVSNPVPYFSIDNNGVMLQMPAVPNGGAGTATGVLTFGIGTQADNSASGLQWLAADSYGNISVTLQGTTYGSSFIDSGSNFYYVPLNNVPTDNNGNYTPAQLTTYPLSLTPNVGTGSAVSQSMLVVNPALIPSASLAIDDVDIDVPNNTGADIGMPFFYGKTMAFLINGASANSGALTGPQYGLSTTP